MTRRRLFFALWPDAVCRERLANAAAPLLGQVQGRAITAADWHITLCFLGAVELPVIATLEAAAEQVAAQPGVGPFTLLLERVHYWRAAQVICASGPAPPAALALAESLRGLTRSLGLRPDDKPLRPHVTLMRGVTAANWRGSGANAEGPRVLNLPLVAEEFQLAESVVGESARRYATIARWSLRS